jgi:hypothetical protein
MLIVNITKLDHGLANHHAVAADESQPPECDNQTAPTLHRVEAFNAQVHRVVSVLLEVLAVLIREVDPEIHPLTQFGQPQFTAKHRRINASTTDSLKAL